MNRLLTTNGWLVLLLILACIGFFIFLFLGFFSKETVYDLEPTVPEPESVLVTENIPVQSCFYRDQVATETEPYEVHEKISLSITGNTVTGTKSGTQSGPDMTNGFEGTLTGTKEEDTMELTYSYTIEGSENKELELYTVTTAGLDKQRYVLKEENGILIPDTTSEVKVISYLTETCI